MPVVSVRREGTGSPEPCANREGTQVNNLCYWRAHRLKTCATRDASGRQAKDAIAVMTGISGPAMGTAPSPCGTEALRPWTRELRSAHRA
jgi:hypothetical protein